MKDIRSLIDMSGTETDCDIYRDLILETEMTLDDVTSCETNHTTDRSRISLLDWAESLIQLSVSTENTASDNQIHNIFSNTYKYERVEELEESPTASAKTLHLSSLSSVNDTQNTSHWQQVNLDDCLNIINTDSNFDSLKKPLSSTHCSFPPNDHLTKVYKQDAATGSDTSSTWTGGATTHLNNSTSSSCVPSHGNPRSLFDCGRHSSALSPDMHVLSNKTSEKPQICERQLTPDSLAGEQSDQFTSDVSLFNVDIDMKTSDSNIAVTTSSNSSLNQSLNTPVHEAYRPLKNTSDSHDFSCGSNRKVHATNLDSSSDSQTLSVERPENYIDLTDPHEEATLSTHVNLLDNQTNQPKIATDFSETTPVFHESDILLTWTQDNLEGITVFISNEAEERSLNSPIQLFQLQSHSNTSQRPTDTVIPQILDSDITISNYEIVELPSDSWTSNLSERYNAQLDISEHPVFQTWSLDRLPSSQDTCNQETRSSVSTSSLAWNTQDDLILHDHNDIHNYCISSEKRPLLFNETWKVTEPSAEVKLIATPQTDSVCNSSFFNIQRAYETSSEKVNSISEVTTKSLPSQNYSDIITSKHIIHPKHKTKRLSNMLIRNNKTLTRHKRTPINFGDKLHFLPEPQITEQQNENQNTESTDTSFQPTLPTSSLLNKSQFNAVSPHRKSHPCEMTFNAIISQEDAYTLSVSSDNLMSIEEIQSNIAQARTSPDISDVSFGCSDFSLTSTSYTDGEGSQEPHTGNKLKDTLRSRLTAKRKMNISSQKNLELKDGGTYFNFGLLTSSSGCPSTSDVTEDNDEQCNKRRLLISSRWSSDSCSSSKSQGDASDTECSYVKDEEDTTSMSFPAQTAEGKEKDMDTRITNNEKRLAKRERNRLAAQKCRRKKSDRVDILTEHVQRLEMKQERIKCEVTKLECEKEELQEMLRLHSFFCNKDGIKKK